MKNKGLINESDFVNLFNNKKFENLPFNAQLFLEDIYPEISNTSRIVAYLADGKYKTDFYLKINYTTFYISLKIGHKNSVHVENIYEFTKRLSNINISNISKETYLKYHFGDGTTTGKGKYRLSSTEMKDLLKDQLLKLNKELNHKEIIHTLTKHSILGVKEIDLLIYGSPENFIWINKAQILDLMLSKEDNINKISPHISYLTIQPLSRCLNYNQKYNRCRYYIQIKWYNIFDDILEYKYNNNLNILF